MNSNQLTSNLADEPFAAVMGPGIHFWEDEEPIEVLPGKRVFVFRPDTVPTLARLGRTTSERMLGILDELAGAGLVNIVRDEEAVDHPGNIICLSLDEEVGLAFLFGGDRG